MPGEAGGRAALLVLAVVLALAALIVSPVGEAEASAAEPYGGVVMMTADGQHLTGAAASTEYAQLVNQKTINCGSCRKYVVITAVRMPFVARNISMAFKVGKPFLLHKVNEAAADGNRKVACGSFQANYEGSCDEYPFASSAEGGAGAHTQEVPRREQRCQCGTLSRQYATQGITDGVQYAVIITDTNDIPPYGYKGTDIAKERAKTC
jgi:Deoxyribonuclease NucA/NucB